MIDQKTSKTSRDRVQAEFEALPLDEKFASLFKMETATVTEAFNMLVNHPMKVVEKVGDVISDLGVKIEAEARKAAASARSKPEPKAAAKPRAAKPRAKKATKPPKPPMG
jgi:DNA-binding transcriptional MocR family regulator